MTIRFGISCHRSTEVASAWDLLNTEEQAHIFRRVSNTVPKRNIPDQQRIAVLNLQYEGHRVTVSVTPGKLASELSFSLPNQIRSQLQGIDNDYQPKYRDSSGCFESNRSKYHVVCSCGKNTCQHVGYATQHFQLLGRFSSVIEEYQQKLSSLQLEMMQVQQKSKGSQQKIKQLEQEINQLENRAGELDKKREVELNEAKEEVELKQLELDEELEDKRQLEEEKESLILEMEEIQEIYHQNMSALNSNWETNSSTEVKESGSSSSINVPVLTSSQLHLDEKYEKNVKSSHHRAKHTHKILKKLARADFIKQLGLEWRQPVKQGKVQIDSQQVQSLKLLVPDNGECDVIRISTTAESKLQQIWAAHQIAAMFEVDVQYPY